MDLGPVTYTELFTEEPRNAPWHLHGQDGALEWDPEPKVKPNPQN